MSLVGKLPLETNVLVNTKDKFTNKPAIVKYVGIVEGVQGQLIGVQLDTPDGIHSGQNKGKKYFKCKDKHGMFLKAKSVTLTDGTPVSKLATGEATIPVSPKRKQKTATVGVKAPSQKTQPKVQQKLVSNVSKKNLTNELQGLKMQQVKIEYKREQRQQSQIVLQNKQLKQKLLKMEQQLQSMKIQSQKIKYAVDTNKEDKLKDLSEQVKFFKDQKQSFEKEKKRLQQKIKQLQKQLQEYAENNELIQNLSMQLQASSNKYDTLKQQLQQTKTQLRNVKSSMNTQMNQGSSGDLNQEINILNETITLLESDLNALKETNEELTKEIQKNKEKVAQYNKLEKKSKIQQGEIQELKQMVDQYQGAANFAQTQTLKIIKKEQQLTQANKQLTQYVNKVEKLELKMKQNQDLILQQSQVMMFLEEDKQALNKTISDKQVRIGQLITQLQKYKQKITQLVKSNQELADQKQIFQNLNKEDSLIPQFTRPDRYQSKYKELKKQYNSISSQYIQNQIFYCQIKNQVGVQMLNLMQSLPEYFTGKFHPQIINVLTLLKTTNDKLYILFDLTSQYLRQRNQVFSKDNIQLAAWMIILLEKISIIHSSLYRIQIAITTSQSQQQAAQIVGQRSLKQQLRRIDIFASQILQRYSTQDISPSISIDPFTQPVQSLDRINFEIKKIFSNQQQTKMKLCSETMKVIQRTFDKIIDYKLGSQLMQNAQLDVNIEMFIKVLLKYLKQCCLNPHIRLRTTMNKYLAGLDMIISIYNQIQQSGSVHQFGNLYSQTQVINLLRQTLVTQQMHAKQLIQDLKDIQYSTTLSKIHVKLSGKMWIERVKLIKDQLLRVKQLALQKLQLQISMTQAKKKIAILEKDAKDKQTVKQLHQKRIGQLQLKVQQSISLQSQNKRHQEKLKVYEQVNKDLADQLQKTNQKKKDAEQESRKLKEKNELLQSQKMMQISKNKLRSNISSEDVASLTIFKNVIKQNSQLKNIDHKKKVWDLKHSLLFCKNNKKEQTKENIQLKAQTQTVRRKALQSMAKMKIFDPRAQSDPNSGLIENLFLELNVEEFNQVNQNKKKKNEVKVGKLLLKGQFENTKVLISQNRSLLQSF